MNKEINIDLRRCLKAIVMKWWMLVIVGVLCYCVAFLFTISSLREDEYTAETTVYSIKSNDFSSLAKYSDIITSSKVCEKASASINISDLTANEIKEMLSINAYSTTLVLGISATSNDKNKAIMVANAVVDAFIEEVNNITSDNSLSMLDEATTAELSYNKEIEQLKLRIFAALAGMVLLCIWITIREILTRKIYNISDMKIDGEIDIIGIVPSFDKKMEGDKK